MTDATPGSRPGPDALTAYVENRGERPGVRAASPYTAKMCLNWGMYDVPRIWEAVQAENTAELFTQAAGWERLAQTIAASYERLLSARDRLASHWKGSEAAVASLTALDAHLADLATNAVAYADTARGVEALAQTLDRARREIAPLKDKWEVVTRDWVPEWWDDAAAELNTQAQAVMIEIDREIAADRERITVPPLVAADRADTTRFGDGTTSGSTPGGGPDVGAGWGQGSPSSQAWASDENAADSSGASFVPSLASGPPSMLPIAPGNPFNPGGGAYVLPVAGTSPAGGAVTGTVIPMTPRSVTSGTAAPSRPGSPGGAGVGAGRPIAGGTTGAIAGSPGMLPMAPLAGAGRPDRHSRSSMGSHTDTAWPLPSIGPAVIEATATNPDTTPGDGFAEWFAGVATPWSTDATVTVRRREMH